MRRFTGLALPAAAFVGVAILLTGGQASGQALTAWVAPRLVRVGQTDAPGTTTSITLSSGRGETIASQVIVQAPAGGLTNVNLSVSALTDGNGHTIPASSITLYREYYVSVSGTTNYGRGSNPPLGSGTYPEPLVPFIDPENLSSLCGTRASLQACNATVSAGQNQPYWIDIFVPPGKANTPRGTYRGNVSITADQGTATIQIALTIWNFDLPLQPSEPSLWSLFPPAAPNTVHTLAEALMRNKVMYWSDDPAYAASDITNLGLDRSGLEFYHNFSTSCDETQAQQQQRQQNDPIPSSSQISAWAANYPASLPLDIYLSDEWGESASCMPPNPSPATTYAYQDVKTTATNAHNATPIVRTILTAFTPDPNLYDEGDGRGAVDHWVLLPSMGGWPSLPWNGPGDLSSYTSCSTGAGYAPEWMVDYPPINERVQAGFLDWTQKAVGILYYRSDGWTNGNTIASWNSVDTTQCGSNSRPGDGIFLYPPGPINSSESAPGIRLKGIRDGIQDYEYARMLHNMGQDAFVDLTLQNYMSWSNWDQNPSDLENTRQSMGQKLDLLNP